MVSTSGKVCAVIRFFYEPLPGNVLIDGKDIRRLRLWSLRKHIALVQHEPSLFSTSVYENIVYGRDGATEAEVMKAAKIVNADSFINGLPDGYATEVGERGKHVFAYSINCAITLQQTCSKSFCQTS